jgi:hypothetical protein
MCLQATTSYVKLQRFISHRHVKDTELGGGGQRQDSVERVVVHTVFHEH